MARDAVLKALAARLRILEKRVQSFLEEGPPGQGRLEEGVRQQAPTRVPELRLDGPHPGQGRGEEGGPRHAHARALEPGSATPAHGNSCSAATISILRADADEFVPQAGGHNQGRPGEEVRDDDCHAPSAASPGPLFQVAASPGPPFQFGAPQQRQNIGNTVFGQSSMGGIFGQSSGGGIFGQSSGSGIRGQCSAGGTFGQSVAGGIFSQSSAVGIPGQSSTDGIFGQSPGGGISGQSSGVCIFGQSSGGSISGPGATSSAQPAPPDTLHSTLGSMSIFPGTRPSRVRKVRFLFSPGRPPNDNDEQRQQLLQQKVTVEMGEAITEYGWADGKKRASIYIEKEEDEEEEPLQEAELKDTRLKVKKKLKEKGPRDIQAPRTKRGGCFRHRHGRWADAVTTGIEDSTDGGRGALEDEGRVRGGGCRHRHERWADDVATWTEDSTEGGRRALKDGGRAGFSRGDAITEYSWTDDRKWVDICIKLDGLDEVPDGGIETDNGARDVTLIVAGLRGGQRRLSLRGLLAPIDRVEVERKKGLNTLVLRLRKKLPQLWPELEEYTGFWGPLLRDDPEGREAWMDSAPGLFD